MDDLEAPGRRRGRIKNKIRGRNFQPPEPVVQADGSRICPLITGTDDGRSSRAPPILQLDEDSSKLGAASWSSVS